MKKSVIDDSSGKGRTLRVILLTMKLLTILIFAGTMAVSASVYSQKTKIDLQISHSTVGSILKSIEENSEFIFIYDSELVNSKIEKSISLRDANIETVLDQLFGTTKIAYLIDDRQIFLYKRDDLKQLEHLQSEVKSVQQQKKTVSGKVTDASRLPIPGVSVIVKGTTTGTITDGTGQFSLSIPGDSKILVFSFVGMKSQEIAIGNNISFDISLEDENFGIEEVVAVGYGTQKKANLTGSVGMATSERLENRPITSAGVGLQGVIPNLNISIKNGDPNTSATFNIRGFESINGGSPLILVDGVPMNLELINPNDIASVTVLKDAAAAAVYGARAAFGVVLVETKNAKKGKINISLSSEQSLAKPIYLTDPVNDPYLFVTKWNEAAINTFGTPTYDQKYVDGTKKWSENPTDANAWQVVDGVLRYYGFNNYWHDLVTNYMPQQKYDLNISGATDKTKYYVSFGILNKDGFLRDKAKNDNYKRYNALMKVEFEIAPWISLDDKIVFNSQSNNQLHQGATYPGTNSIARLNPIAPIQFPDLPYYLKEGDHEQFAPYIGMYFDGSDNPVYNGSAFPYIEQGGRDTYNSLDLWLTQGITITPVKGLRIRSDFSYNAYFNSQQKVNSKVQTVVDKLTLPSLSTYGSTANDDIQNQTNYNQYYVFNAYAEYTLDKIKDHFIKAMVGFNQEWGRNQMVRAQAFTLITPLITDLNATTGTQLTAGNKSQVALRGLFYRLNYSFKDKYLIEANGRYDGTSRFPKESRFGFFPSVSAGWRISNESFMAGTKGWLDNLKMRASYGELGNQLLGNNYYPYISTMGVGSSSYMLGSSFTPYASAAGLVSPSLTWETVATQNIGLDFTILNQRLDVSADFYTRDTKNMLMKVSYPDVLGTNAPNANAADLRTKGWELAVTWRDKIGQDLKYGLTLSLSDNQSEITKYNNPTGAINDYYIGKKIGEIWGYETEGIFQTPEDVLAHADQTNLGANWKPGDMMYKDLNDDKKINGGTLTLADPGDRKVIGNTTPRYSFGINPDVTYKNWSLNIYFQGLFRDYLPGNGPWGAFYPYNSNLMEKYYITETWSPENPDAYFARPYISSTGGTKNIHPQSRFVQNAAYVRLKNLTVNYNLPQSFIGKVGLSKAQFYFSGQNLWEYTKMHKPLDPESVDFDNPSYLAQQYFFQRIFTLGVKVTF